MKPTKRAKKNQARQKLKLDSERTNKESIKQIQTFVHTVNYEKTDSNSESVNPENQQIPFLVIMSLLFVLTISYIATNPVSESEGLYSNPQSEKIFTRKESARREAQVINDAFKDNEKINGIRNTSLNISPAVGSEPITKVDSENTEYAIIKKHQIERIKTDNFTYPTVTQVLERVFERVFYTSENKSANHKTIKQEVQIPRDEIIENLSKKSSYLASMDSSRSSRIQQDIDELANAIYNVGYQEEREGKIINVYERSKERDALIALVENYKESKIDEKVFKKSLNEFKPKYIKAVNETINQQNATEPTNEDYETILSFDKNLLVVVEEKSKTHTNNSDSKDEITENLKKESAFLLASENTEEGKLRNAFSQTENELNTTEDERPSPIVALLKIMFPIFSLWLVFFPSTVKSILYKALGKEELKSYQPMESERVVQAKFVLKVSDTDDARYSNKL